MHRILTGMLRGSCALVCTPFLRACLQALLWDKKFRKYVDLYAKDEE
jgi:hypothetical protein